MWVTIYTDGSCRGKRCRWAIWAKCELGRIILDGDCPPSVAKSSDAELYAIAKGAQVVSIRWPSARCILFCTDFRAARSMLLGPRRYSGMTGRIKAKFHDFVGGRRTRFRWIRGHQPVRCRPTFLNNAVDKLASK